MPFQNPYALLLVFPVLAALVYIVRKDFVSRLKRKDVMQQIVRKRTLLLVTRSLIFLLLIVAVASPFSLHTSLKKGDPSLTILVDNSTSMSMLDRSLVHGLQEKLGRSIPVRIRSFGSGEVSNVGDALLSAISGNDNILLVSDGNSNYGRSMGDMAVVAAAMNSTVNALVLKPARDDVAVVITGPRITTNAEDNDFKVVVSQVGADREYQLKVSIDGDEVVNGIYSGSQIATITRKFAEGYHVIKAEVVINDYFAKNNVFFKTVKVEQRPRVLFVSKTQSPMSDIFNVLYRTTTVSSMHSQDISDYSAVVINDIPASEIDASRLGDYVIDGNGLVVIGGRNSYDRGGYKDSLLEGMLPVRVGRGKEGQRTDVNIVLVIDISGSTGSGFSQKSSSSVEEVEKALSIGILKGLRPQDRVAVVAFNAESYIVTDLVRVLGNENAIEDRIQRLVYKGGTRIDAGIKAARKILAPLEGSKNMIIFSDGKSGGYSEDIYDAQISANTGIKIYTVGVGEGTDRRHLQDIAFAGNGFYFEPDETERFKVIFGDSEASSGLDTFPVEVVNSHHFITAGISPSASVTGFNQVVPKPNADMLVATQSNNPLLTASRLGLGRIVAFSTDDGSAWAGELLSSRNSVLVSRAVNWAVGDLSRNKDFDVDMRDAYLNEELDVNIISSSLPKHDGLKFSKIGKRLYTASLVPGEAGIIEFFGAVVAVNYPREYSVVGMNPSVESYISVSGGKLFNPEDAEGILEKVKEDSKRIVSEPHAYSWIFLLAALLVFLFEVAVRRIQEGRQK